jgi:general secretion pathway protein J
MTPAPRRTEGFTLVEMLVTLVLAALVVSALATLTAQWLPNWKRGINRVENVERVSLALRRVTADLGAAAFVPAGLERPRPLFDGRPASITFVRPALGPNARPGLEIVRLASDDGLTRSAAPYVPRRSGDAMPAFGAPVVLLRAPYQLDFSYAGSDGLWLGAWTNLDELPRAVRIVVRDARTGRALDISTVALLNTELPAACVSNAALPICNGAAPPDDEPPPGTADKTP